MLAESTDEVSRLVAQVERHLVEVSEVARIEADVGEERTGVLWLSPRLYHPDEEGES